MEVGKSTWLTVSQERINDFARATGDFQWIHVDEERAKTDSPFGRTIAHGFLTLSLIPVMFEKVVAIDGIRMAVNYGTNKVRFLAPVPSESKIRLSATLSGFADTEDGGRATFTCAVELEGKDKPACLAEVIVMYYE
jgi:NADPH:quinone reductase